MVQRGGDWAGLHVSNEETLQRVEEKQHLVSLIRDN